ncbi:hypothetical protein [Microbulbifer sp. THAF38]|uniref:hypothetical protein n=1 Tax=Microbulbifer sp. THAF38 TaxID=2587856 RepID=UPI0012687A75|nr:hypothetical protein [Microbulbifer sp. THAF38]QFT54917.1 hypothetical protein FIU95_10150 [Microbulbifer sp. THAF38]
MKAKPYLISKLLPATMVLAAVYSGQLSANPDSKNSIDGTWCAVDGESFILYESKKDALNVGKDIFCRTFKVLKKTKTGGGGRFIDSFKKPADIKHKLSGVEETKDGGTVGKDIGIFAFSNTGDTTRIVTVDVSDESVGNFTLDSSGKMHGFIEEVTSDAHVHEAHVGVLSFKRTPGPIPAVFDKEWQSVFDATHKKTATRPGIPPKGKSDAAGRLGDKKSTQEQ